MHATDDLVEILPLAATLLPDGSILLDIAVSGLDDLTTVTVPATKVSRLLAAGETHQLDLDELERFAPPLATMIRDFAGHIREHLTERQFREGTRAVRRGR